MARNSSRLFYSFYPFSSPPCILFISNTHPKKVEENQTIFPYGYIYSASPMEVEGGIRASGAGFSVKQIRKRCNFTALGLFQVNMRE
jgi:hypothetical protein